MIPKLFDLYLRRQNRHNVRAMGMFLQRRERRKTGKLGKLWRWLYSAYDKRLAAEYQKYMAALSPGEWVRNQLREEGFKRKIMPVQALPDEYLNK